MSTERQAKPIPLAWSKHGPLGTLFLIHGLAWAISEFWHHIRHGLLANSLGRRDTDHGDDGVAHQSPHSTSRLFGDPIPIIKNPSRCYSELIRRAVGPLSIPPCSRKEGVAFPLISVFLSATNQPFIAIAAPWYRSWPYITIRRRAREKFRFADGHFLAVGEGAG